MHAVRHRSDGRLEICPITHLFGRKVGSVGTLLVTLHVIVVVLVVGPMVVAPFLAGRAIARHDPNLARVAGNALLTYGFGSLIAAGLGGLAVGASDGKYGFGTPWVIISMTLYVLVLVLAVGYTAPASRKAAKMIEALAPAKPPGGAASARTPPKPATPPAASPDALAADDTRGWPPSRQTCGPSNASMPSSAGSPAPAC